MEKEEKKSKLWRSGSDTKLDNNNCSDSLES